MDDGHTDILSIAGVTHSDFYSNGQNIKLIHETGQPPYARLLKKSGGIIYRAGFDLLWWDDNDDHAVSLLQH